MPRNVRPVGLDPRLSSGMDANFGDASFDLYHPVDVYLPRSATPSSGYSFNLYDAYQASNYSGPSSEVDYFGASGFSTPTSGLDLFDDNASEPNLDWDPSLASFFDSVEATALGSGSNPSFLESNGMTHADSYAPFSDSTRRFLATRALGCSWFWFQRLVSPAEYYSLRRVSTGTHWDRSW